MPNICLFIWPINISTPTTRRVFSISATFPLGICEIGRALSSAPRKVAVAQKTTVRRTIRILFIRGAYRKLFEKREALWHGRQRRTGQNAKNGMGHRDLFGFDQKWQAVP